MNRKHQKTLKAIFSVPTLASINFADIEKLLVALGASVAERSGSRLSFTIGGDKLFIHRPHPSKEAKKYQVEAVRDFLELVGVKNE
jgi:HicA toxin of bacterial toxin-antitoxin,